MWLLLFTFTSLVLAETYNVDVGRTGLTFEPSTLHNIEVGDVVNFHFYPSNHSVAESTYEKPCKPKSGGVDDKPIWSGFIPVDDGVASEMWSVTIDRTDPIWLYCSQGDHQHCRNGQVMVINPLNNTDQTLDGYMEAAYNANVTSPDEIFGGTLVQDDGGQPNQVVSRRGGRSKPKSSSSSDGNEVVTVTSGVNPVMSSWLQALSVGWFWGVVFFVTL